jgi:hypothetical protein
MMAPQRLSELEKLCRRAIAPGLAKQLGATPADFPTLQSCVEGVNKTTSLKLIQDMDLATEIDVLLTDILDEAGLLEGTQGIEFPATVRVAHGKAPDGYLAQGYATDFLHSDLWAGEPYDVVNLFIYVGGDVERTRLMLTTPRAQDLGRIEGFRGPYQEIIKSLSGLDPVQYAPRAGQLIAFDGTCPHQTVREGGGCRVSLDFRLRRVDPYTIVDERWDRAKPAIPWSKYWYLNTPRVKTFKARVMNELSLLETRGRREALRARTDWVKKYHPGVL